MRCWNESGTSATNTLSARLCRDWPSEPSETSTRRWHRPLESTGPRRYSRPRAQRRAKHPDPRRSSCEGHRTEAGSGPWAGESCGHPSPECAPRPPKRAERCVRRQGGFRCRRAGTPAATRIAGTSPAARAIRRRVRASGLGHNRCPPRGRVGSMDLPTLPGRPDPRTVFRAQTARRSRHQPGSAHLRYARGGRKGKAQPQGLFRCRVMVEPAGAGGFAGKHSNRLR